MKNRKVIDYIVIEAKGTIKTEGRIYTKEENFSLKKKRATENININKKDLKNLTVIQLELQELLKLENGNRYPVIAHNSVKGYYQDYGYSHPFTSNNIADKKDTKIFNLSSVEKSINKIIKEKEKLDETIKYNIVFLEKLEKELNDLKNNDNTMEHRTKRSSFEEEVQRALNEGYELQGGVCIKYGAIFQALVKYQD